MAVQLTIGRTISAALAISLVVTSAVFFDAAAPVQAGHFLTHPAGTPAEPNAPSLAALAAGQADVRSVSQVRAQSAPGASGGAATLFEEGFKINVERDASVYITSRNIPENDRLLEAYGVESPNGGGVRPRAAEATVAPGLLGIAAQARRYQWRGEENGNFTLANAMRDAIWRKKTAAKLDILISQHRSRCANGTETSTATPMKGC